MWKKSITLHQPNQPTAALSNQTHYRRVDGIANHDSEGRRQYSKVFLSWLTRSHYFSESRLPSSDIHHQQQWGKLGWICLHLQLSTVISKCITELVACKAEFLRNHAKWSLKTSKDDKEPGVENNDCRICYKQPSHQNSLSGKSKLIYLSIYVSWRKGLNSFTRTPNWYLLYISICFEIKSVV